MIEVRIFEGKIVVHMRGRKSIDARGLITQTQRTRFIRAASATLREMASAYEELTK